MVESVCGPGEPSQFLPARARGVAWAEHGSHCIVDNLISRCAQRNAMTPAIDPCQQHLTRGPVSNAFTCGKAKQVNGLYFQFTCFGYMSNILEGTITEMANGKFW